MGKRIRLWGLIGLGLVSTASTPGLGQDRDTSPHEQAMMQKWAAYATPGAAHADLAEFAGDREWTSTWWMHPGAPPETSSGTSTAEMILGGRYLSETMEGTAMGQPFQGRALTGYDNQLQEYFSVWVDNMGTGVLITRGKYDPASKALVMTGTFDDFMDGKKKPVRTVMSRVDENTTRFEMFMPGPEGKEFKTMEVVSRREGT
ncbi:MAG: DUF1579 domain-containing protein [Gemmatimonadota bacterium]